jgi:hypothetical protein
MSMVFLKKNDFLRRESGRTRGPKRCIGYYYFLKSNILGKISLAFLRICATFVITILKNVIIGVSDADSDVYLD